MVCSLVHPCRDSLEHTGTIGGISQAIDTQRKAPKATSLLAFRFVLMAYLNVFRGVRAWSVTALYLAKYLMMYIVMYLVMFIVMYLVMYIVMYFVMYIVMYLVMYIVMYLVMYFVMYL